MGRLWLLLLLSTVVRGIEKFESPASPAVEPAGAFPVPAGAVESRCGVETVVAWQTTLGSGAMSLPSVADFDNDGRKELLFATASCFVEAVVGRSGERAEGWPMTFTDSIFLAAPLVYDVDRSGTLDVVVTTEAGEIAFIQQSGVPLYNYTLKLSPVPLSHRWFDGLTDQYGEGYWEMVRKRDVRSTPTRYRNRGWNADNRYGVDQRAGDAGEAEGRVNFPERLELTDKGLKSFELFLKTSLPHHYGERLSQQLNPLHSPTYRELVFDPATEALVPPHVLATPIIADLLRDGTDQLIVPVSYFFTAAQARHARRYNLGEHVDGKMFSVAGVAVFDLATHSLLWQTELGATVNAGKAMRAFVYGSPVAADIDGSGDNEIIVADGSGHVHVLSATGDTVAPWPVRLGPLAARPVVEDVAGDARLEIIVLDAHGNLVCFDSRATELWSVRVFTGSVPPLDHAPTLGDVDGNGSLDLVLGTAAGFVYAVDAATGAGLPGFPLRMPDGVLSEIALVRLRPPGLHLAFSAGSRLYLVDGSRPHDCIESVALGGDSFTAVAVDDFTGRGRVDLVVTLASGHVMCLSTDAPFHPLSAWSTPWSGGVKTTTNFGVHGIFAENRGPRDVSGSTLPLQFTIVDERGGRRGSASGKAPARYNVTISINGFAAFQQSYAAPGTYTAHLPVPHRSFAAVTLWMENEAHQVFTDFFSVSFNIRFYRLLKHVLLAPLALLLAIVVFATQKTNEPLL